MPWSELSGEGSDPWWGAGSWATAERATDVLNGESEEGRGGRWTDDSHFPPASQMLGAPGGKMCRAVRILEKSVDYILS